MSTDPEPGKRHFPTVPVSPSEGSSQVCSTPARQNDHRCTVPGSRLYRFASWPRLKSHIELFGEIGQLEQAINCNDIVRIKTLMTRNSAAQRSARFSKDGPLTSVAECRVPWESPGSARLAMAESMIAHG